MESSFKDYLISYIQNPTTVKSSPTKIVFGRDWVTITPTMEIIEEAKNHEISMTEEDTIFIKQSNDYEIVDGEGKGVQIGCVAIQLSRVVRKKDSEKKKPKFKLLSVKIIKPKVIW